MECSQSRYGRRPCLPVKRTLPCGISINVMLFWMQCCVKAMCFQERDGCSRLSTPLESLYFREGPEQQGRARAWSTHHGRLITPAASKLDANSTPSSCMDPVLPDTEPREKLLGSTSRRASGVRSTSPHPMPVAVPSILRTTILPFHRRGRVAFGTPLGLSSPLAKPGADQGISEMPTRGRTSLWHS